RCRAVLRFADKRPRFCSTCGQALSGIKEESTVDYESEAATLAPPSSWSGEVGAVPDVVGSYRLIQPLGSGAMGMGYEAEDTVTGRHVALKLIAPEYASSPEAVERFRREGRLASQVVHPRCVFVLAVDEARGRPYIVMELMPGSTLKDLVDKQ